MVCGAHPVDLHHVDYQRLGEERDEDLRSLCRSCHGGVHLLADWGAASLWTAAEDYARMANDFVASSRESLAAEGAREAPTTGMVDGQAFLAFKAFARYVLADRLATAARLYLQRDAGSSCE